MNERLTRTGLLVPAVLAEAVGAAACAVPALAPVAAAVCGLLLALAVVLAVRRPGDRRRVVAVACLVAVGAVLLSMVLAEPRRYPPGLPLGRPVEAAVRLETVARVTSNDVAGGLTGRSVLHGVLLRWSEPGRSTADGDPANGAVVPRDADSPVTLFADGTVRAAPGSTLRIAVVLRRAPPTDASAYLGSVSGSLRVVEQPGVVQAAADALRRGFAVRATRLSGDGAALLPGLAIGDTTAVSAGLNQAMRNASLSHLTAVSGANCAVVIAGVLALAALAGVPRMVRLLLAGAALAGFVVLVTPQPSVVRAATMAAIVLGCLATGRRAAGVPVLSLAVILLLVADPWLSWSAGFVLSVLATGGLLLLTRPIAALLQRVLPPAPALLVAVPIAAQIACQPVLILLQPAVPVAGVVANLAAEPAAPVATVLGLLACLIGPVAPPLADGLTLLAWLPSAWIALVARIAGDLPQVPWLPGAPGAVLAGALAAATVVVLVRSAPRRLRIAAVGALVAVVLALAGATAGSAVARVAALPSDWEIAACDVGQGDGLVLNGGGGHVAVIDTGRQPPAISACLARLGIGRIDLLVLTHWDADHVGAATALVGRVGTVFVGPTDRSAAVSVQTALAAGGARVLQVHRGDATRVGRLRLDVLWPPDPLNGVEPGNPASVTILVHGRLTSVFTGDLGEDAQNALLAAGPMPQVDVVKVAHHGSADQSPAFYAAVDASLGLISVGADNDYGHPTARLLGILRDTGTEPIRTDQSGLILVSGADGRVRVWSERPSTSAVWTPAK